MKKLYISFLAILAILITSCSSSKTPAGTVELYLKALKHQEFYDAAKCQIPDNNNLASSANILRDALSKNPIKKYSILGTVEQNDDHAIVAVKIVWINDIEPDNITLVPVSKVNGKWYIGDSQPQEQHRYDMDYQSYEPEEYDLNAEYEGEYDEQALPADEEDSLDD